MMSNLALHQMMAWLSPGYPIGAFSYSHGLEQAIEAGDVCNGTDLRAWLLDVLERGSGWNDALILCQAYRAPSDAELEDVADLAEALCASKERHLEIMAQGRAFAKITSEIWDVNLREAPLPVCLGQAAALQHVELSALLPLYLHSFVANIVAAGVRFIPLGQTDGQRVLASLFEPIDAIAADALDASFDQLGGICFLADMASMQHETMTTRIFRT